MGTSNVRLPIFVGAVLILIVACAPAPRPGQTQVPATQNLARQAAGVPTPKTSEPTAGRLASIGGTVSVLGVWSGDEQASFLAMVRPFEEQTGIQVQFEGTRDLNGTLSRRIQAGNPPDIAGLPGPGQMAEFATQGALVELSDVLDMAAMRTEYAEDWLRLGQVGGRQFGIFIRSALKGLIWYSPKVYEQAGYQIPATWDEMVSESEKIASGGTAPWCLGLESGAASGWAGTDWLENIVLRQAGPDVYDRWHRGEIRWSSAEIKKAWQTWGEIVAHPEMVLGGKQGMLTTNFQIAGNPLFSSPPGCYLHHQASFITNNFTDAHPDLSPGEDFRFFRFPDIDPRHSSAIEGAGDLFGMFRDTPQSRALMKYLTTPEAQTVWVKRGGALSANRRVLPDAYPNQLSRQLAQTLTGAETVRFDASDLMPDAMNDAFWKAVLDYVSEPESLDTILAQLDSVQGRAQKE